MQKLFYEKQLSYTGKELSPHWIYSQFGLKGNAIVSFMGPCSVKTEDLIDCEDAKNRDEIYSPLMLHFLVEVFDNSLESAILRQYLLVTSIQELIHRLKPDVLLTRDGNDLYTSDRKKLNVSIATASPVSTLIHVGINIQTQGTPVPTLGLEELDVDPSGFASLLMDTFCTDMENMAWARCKVHPAGGHH